MNFSLEENHRNCSNVNEIWSFIKKTGTPTEANTLVYTDITLKTDPDQPLQVLIQAPEIGVFYDGTETKFIYGDEHDLEILANFVRLLEITQGEEPGDVL